MCFGSSKQTTNSDTQSAASNNSQSLAQNSSTADATTQANNAATNSSTGYSAPNNPAIAPAETSLVNQATSLAAQPLQQYTGNLVAGLTPEQQAAITQIQGAGSLASPYLTQAGQYAAAGATPITTTPFSAAAVDQYESPYLADVLQTTQASQNQQNQQQQQSLAGNITAAGAWGGDRSAVAQAELAGQQKLADNQTNAGIENQGYSDALAQFNQGNQTSLATQEANSANSFNAANAYGNIGSALQNNALTAGQASLNAGTLQQQINQENLNVPYEQYLQAQGYPYQSLDFLSGILGSSASASGTTTGQTGSSTGTAAGTSSGTNTGLTSGYNMGSSSGTSSGTNTQQTSSPFGGQLLGLGLDAASLFLADGGRARLADGGTSYDYRPLPAVPTLATFIPAVSPSGGSLAGANMGGGSSGTGSPQGPSLSGGTAPNAYASTAPSLTPVSFGGGGGGSGGGATSNGLSSAASNFGSALQQYTDPLAPITITPEITPDGGFMGGAGNSGMFGLGGTGGLFDDIGGGLSSAGSFLDGLKEGGRARLADGGSDDPVYDEGNDPTGGDDASYYVPAPAPTGASALSLADTPTAWRDQATNFAPDPTQGNSLANPPLQDIPAGYVPLGPNAPISLAASPSGAAAPAPAVSGPAWDDGTPVNAPTDEGEATGPASLASAAPAASGDTLGMAHAVRVIPPVYTATPDWRRALMTAGSAMMAANTGNGLRDVGAGLNAGVQNYYAQLDKDNHPEVDHSGPTTIVRYADGTTVDTGLPTEAALNAKASNDYKVSNSQTISADRQAAIKERGDAAAAAVAERAAAATQASLDRANALAVARINANAGRYGQPVPGTGLDATGKSVPGAYITNEKTGDLEFHPGVVLTGKEPAAGSAGAGLPGREGVMFQRVAAAGNSAAATAHNIMRLPSDSTSTGIFGGRQQGHGLLAAAKESLTNTLTSQSVQDYNAMVPGVTRNLGALETQGLAVPGSMTHSMDGTLLKEGDSQLTKLRKMAEMRQIVETNLEPSLSNPRLPPEQKQLVQTIIGKIQTAIPFTHDDITDLETSNNPKMTISDVVKARLGKTGNGAAPIPAMPHGVPAGSSYSPSRKMWRDQNGQIYNAQGQPVH